MMASMGIPVRAGLTLGGRQSSNRPGVDPSHTTLRVEWLFQPVSRGGKAWTLRPGSDWVDGGCGAASVPPVTGGTDLAGKVRPSSGWRDGGSPQGPSIQRLAGRTLPGASAGVAENREVRPTSRYCLLGALATLVVWLVGLAGRAMRWHHHLRANTERRREVLSTFFIGRQLIGHRDHDLTPSLLAFALFTLRRLVLQALPV